MNKGKRTVSSRLNKKMHKDIKSAQQAFSLTETRTTSDKLAPKLMLKNYPKNLSKRDLNAVLSEKKRMDIKLRKHKKTSKRTTPGSADMQTAPTYGHAEGARWMKTVITQNVGQRKALSKHMIKQRAPKRK